jgi:hypothetical protein
VGEEHPFHGWVYPLSENSHTNKKHFRQIDGIRIRKELERGTNGLG